MADKTDRNLRDIFESGEKIEDKYEKAFSQLGGVQTIFPTELKEQLRDNFETVVTEHFKTGKTNHYSHMKAAIDDFYKSRGDFITIEPIGVGKVRPDIMGLDSAGELIIGEIKKSKELDGGLNGYWKQWNSDKNQFGGKTTDFRLDSCYSDKAASLALQEKGWLAVTDGQLRHYCSEHGVSKGSLVVENFSGYEPSVKSALDYLKQQGRVKSYKISLDKSGNAHVDIKFNGIKDRSDTAVNTVQVELGKLQKKAIINDSVKAAKCAAAISAVASGAFNTFHFCKLVREGKMSGSEATIKIATETVSAAADSALKAASNTAAQGLIKAYGTKGLLKHLAGRTNFVTTAILCAIDAAKDIVMLSQGKMTKDEFYERNGKNVVTTSAGVMGSSIGGGLGGSLGSIVGLTKAGAMLGGCSGALIAGLAVQFAIAYHVEKPYQELISNTVLLNKTMNTFKEVSESIFIGQVNFTKFIDKEIQQDEGFQSQLLLISEARERMTGAIDRL